MGDQNLQPPRSGGPPSPSVGIPREPSPDGAGPAPQQDRAPAAPAVGAGEIEGQPKGKWASSRRDTPPSQRRQPAQETITGVPVGDYAQPAPQQEQEQEPGEPAEPPEQRSREPSGEGARLAPQQDEEIRIEPAQLAEPAERREEPPAPPQQPQRPQEPAFAWLRSTRIWKCICCRSCQYPEREPLVAYRPQEAANNLDEPVLEHRARTPTNETQMTTVSAPAQVAGPSRAEQDVGINQPGPSGASLQAPAANQNRLSPVNSYRSPNAPRKPSSLPRVE